MPNAPRSTRHVITAMAATVLLLLAMVGCSSSSGSDAGANGSASDGSAGDGSNGQETSGSTTSTTAATTTTTAPPELPGGGRTIFPGHRVVGFYGNAESAALGVLGETPPAEAVPRLAAAAAPFAEPDKPVLGAFELIVSVAQGSPGADGDYSAPTPPEEIQPWIDAATDNGLLVVLDVQPGRASFVDEVKRYEFFLAQPGVSLALDAEWRMGPGEVPGQKIGQVQASEVNEVSAWLSELVQRNNLPQKLFIIHQFTEDMIQGRPFVLERPGLATVFHIDGFGTQAAKLSKYAQLHVDPPRYNGYKLFYDEDIDMMTPPEALALTPSPDLITYQ